MVSQPWPTGCCKGRKSKQWPGGDPRTNGHVKPWSVRPQHSVPPRVPLYPLAAPTPPFPEYKSSVTAGAPTSFPEDSGINGLRVWPVAFRRRAAALFTPECAGTAPWKVCGGRAPSRRPLEASGSLRYRPRLQLWLPASSSPGVVAVSPGWAGCQGEAPLPASSQLPIVWWNTSELNQPSLKLFIQPVLWTLGWELGVTDTCHTPPPSCSWTRTAPKALCEDRDGGLRNTHGVIRS